jgi:DNA-binding response OmpR family regulator
MDFVMTRPAMRKLFPHFCPVMSQLSRVSARVRKESEQYVRELGLATATPVWEAKEGKIWLRGKAIGKEMSKLEKKMMKLLIERGGELATYDELADAVWGVGEFKTYWALNKLVERLRPKLIKLGGESTTIESVRGQGYILS